MIQDTANNLPANSAERKPRELSSDSKDSGYFTPQFYRNDNEITLTYLVTVIARYKYIIAGCALLGMIASGIMVFRAVPIYRAQALMIPVTDNAGKSGLSSLASQFGDLASLAGADLSGSNSGKNEAIALLRSRAFTEKFLREENLLPELYADKWDAVNKTWKVTNEEEIPTLWHGFNFFDSTIRFIEEDKKTGLLTLAIEWKDPKQAAIWANMLVKRLNYETRERTITEAKKSLSYLDQELAKNSSVELQQVIYRLIENQIKTIMLANVRDEYAFKVIDPPAIAPKGAYIKPKRSLLLGLGFAIGMIFGLIAALSHYLWSLKIKT